MGFFMGFNMEWNGIDSEFHGIFHGLELRRPFNVENWPCLDKSLVGQPYQPVSYCAGPTRQSARWKNREFNGMLTRQMLMNISIYTYTYVYITGIHCVILIIKWQHDGNIYHMWEWSISHVLWGTHDKTVNLGGPNSRFRVNLSDIQSITLNFLVGGFWNSFFHSVGNVIIPTGVSYFSEG
jgi:hypothetical protein